VFPLPIRAQKEVAGGNACDQWKGEVQMKKRSIQKRAAACSICSDVYEGFGNNAWPFEGRCCDECRRTEVFPARLVKLKEFIDAKRIDAKTAQLILSVTK
jgi:hypothetical protein